MKRAEAVDTVILGHTRAACAIRTIGWCAALAILSPRAGRAQEMNGSMRLSYQNNGVATDKGTLAQQYYVRMTDRLFVKNVMVFTGNFYYRTGSDGSPVDFRPRYELQLSSTGYSGRVGYEPFTIRRFGVRDEEFRRWRTNAVISPDRWPRLSYDMTRVRQERGSAATGRDDWNAFNLNWQGGPRVLAATYSRQTRSSRDSLSEKLEIYRALTSTDIPLPGQGRLSLSYSFDRTTNARSPLPATELDQHVPAASASVAPARWVNLTSQYSGRYISRRVSAEAEESSNDQLATGTLTITPNRHWSFGMIRYFERVEERLNQDRRSTDYWQVRASADRMFFRRITGQFTAYRIAYAGAREGARFSDAYFMALRGRPHRHAELSSEFSMADRHGLQSLRYAVSTTSYLRLYPTRGTQAQFSYNAIAESPAQAFAFNISEEGYTGNLQFTPDAKLSLNGGATIRRNRLLGSDWDVVWSASSTYRWPGFANISAHYNKREQTITTPASGPTPANETPAQESLILTVDVWLGPSTSISANYSWRDGGSESQAFWGLGLTTQF